MDRRGGVIAIFKRAALLALTAVTCVTLGSSAVVAEPRKNLQRGVIVDLPGVDASKVDINFEQNVLTIRGTKSSAIEPSKEGELRVYAAERVAGSFERTVRLPEFVDGERIAAEFKNGLLTVTVPKAAAAQARKIEVK